MSKQGRNCQIPTPSIYVEEMLDYIGYRENICNKKVLENSCGEGNILIGIVRRFILDGKKRGHSVQEIATKLEKNVIGYEIDESKIQICIQRLNDLLQEEEIPEAKWNIKKEDFLLAQEKVDYIVGNPPYITYHDLEEEERSFLQLNFQVCKQGRFDYCYAFIEASIHSLKEDGKMVYLVPYSIFRNKFAARLRSFLESYVIGIWDYRGVDVFRDITCSATVIACQKHATSQEIIYRYMSDGIDIRIDRSDLKKTNGQKWIFQKKTSGKKRFGDYFEVCNSVATLLNDAFLIEVIGETEDCYQMESGLIEKEVTYPAISTKGARKKRQQNVMEERIIFPYKRSEDGVEGYGEEEFRILYPYAYAHLEKYREELNNRKADRNALWYEYGRSQALERVWGEKVIIPMVITKKAKAYMAGATHIPYAGYFIKARKGTNMTLMTAKQIIESDAFYQYVQDVGTPTTKTSYRISVFDLVDYEF